MDDIFKNDDYWNIGLSEDVYETIMKNKDRLNSAINHDNDYILDYFGFKVILLLFSIMQSRKFSPWRFSISYLAMFLNIQ